MDPMFPWDEGDERNFKPPQIPNTPWKHGAHLLLFSAHFDLEPKAPNKKGCGEQKWRNFKPDVETCNNPIQKLIEILNFFNRQV